MEPAAEQLQVSGSFGPFQLSGARGYSESAHGTRRPLKIYGHHLILEPSFFSIKTLLYVPSNYETNRTVLSERTLLKDEAVKMSSGENPSAPSFPFILDQKLSWISHWKR